MTATEILDNIFFGFFYTFGDYLPVIFAFILVVVLIASFLNTFLGRDR